MWPQVAHFMKLQSGISILETRFWADICHIFLQYSCKCSWFILQCYLSNILQEYETKSFLCDIILYILMDFVSVLACGCVVWRIFSKHWPSSLNVARFSLSFPLEWNLYNFLSSVCSVCTYLKNSSVDFLFTYQGRH